MDTFIKWWRQPDRYEWLSDYLESQQLRWPLQVLMAVTVCALGSVPAILYWSPTGPKGPIQSGTAFCATALCAVMAIVWLSGWPSRRNSRMFAVLSALTVAAACLTTEPHRGLLACVVFAVIAGLVALTHTSPFLTVVLGIAIIATVVCGVREGRLGDPAGALSETLLVLVAIHTGPTFSQVLVQLLGADAASSSMDALTGLRNRRGFYRATADKIDRAADTPGAYLGVVMIDLDNFKQVNDTKGHAAGDDVLVGVADVLRRMCGSDAVVARVGGEEFCIAVIARATRVSALAHVVCTAIDAMPNTVTASIGAVAHQIRESTATATIDELINAADDAMYIAKRAGGNRVHLADHCSWINT